jgi:hypothetical protein
MAYTRSRTHLRLTRSAMLIPWMCLLAACGGGGNGEAPAEGAAEVLAATGTSRTASPSGAAALAVDGADWAELLRPFDTLHEALPAGVPAGYDWRDRSRRHAGNRAPTGFMAYTGWAQAFWAVGAAVGSQRLELRQMQSLLCLQTAAGPVWQRVQQGSLEGASFRADFAGDDNVPAEKTAVDAGTLRVGFGAERAYHFWPRQGRVVLGDMPLCGMLVMFQARAVAPDGQALPPGTTPALLAGAGADYWLDTRASWDNFRTNAPVGSGQLRLVLPQWRWYGMATGDSAAMALLRRDGFADRSNP